MRRIMMLGVVGIALFGCEEGGGPESGTWNFVAGDLTRNTCNYDQVGGIAGDFTLSNDGDGSLTIDPEDGTDPFECDLDGDDFDCAERFQGESPIMGYDAVLHTHARADGSFSSSTEGSGAQHGRVECEGADCGALATLVGATLPCEFSETFTARLRD
jgi:hypothetical protein